MAATQVPAKNDKYVNLYLQVFFVSSAEDEKNSSRFDVCVIFVHTQNLWITNYYMLTVELCLNICNQDKL